MASELDSVWQALAGVTGNADVAESEASQILCVCDDHAFVWVAKDFTVLAAYLSRDRDDGLGRLQTFSLTDTPIFEVERVAASHSGSRLLLSGSRGVMCVELPRRSGKSGRFAEGQKEVTCRSYGVAEQLFLSQPKLLVQHVAWHPGSTVVDSMVAVLASDNYLRFYNLNVDALIPEQSFSLTSMVNSSDITHAGKSDQPPSSTSFFRDSSVSVRASLGETAVAFAFAPAVAEADDVSSLTSVWPVFILYGNGEVYCLLTGLGDAHTGLRLLGPLTMHPETVDNYGVDSCSLLCLHPTISSPPLLVIATNSGKLYHCVILNGEDRTTVGNTQWSMMSVTGGDDRPEVTTNLGLYVYECVELGLGLSAQDDDSDMSRRPFNCPVRLAADPTTPSRYFAWHNNGVHCVGLPMVARLVELAQAPDGAEEPLWPMLADEASRGEESVVEHLVCTNLSGSQANTSPVLGLAVHYPPTRLICLLSGGQPALTMALSAPYFWAPPPLLSSAVTLQDASVESGRHLHQSNKECFVQKIKNILRKESKLPQLKTSLTADLSPQECLRLVTKSTQILREEYMVRLDAARTEIEKRAATLAKVRGKQEMQLTNLRGERATLRSKAAEISERYEDLSEKGEALKRRLECILQKVQALTPTPSDAELRMARSLRDIQRRTHDLGRALDQLRAKQRYQDEQEEEAKRQRGVVGKRNAPPGESLNVDQLTSVKEMLTSDSKDISDLMRQVNTLKSALAL